MGLSFTKGDLEIFEVSGFKERMTLLKNGIRPKLVSFGESLAPKLEEVFHRPFFIHVAKHLRRKVNPPDETWVALGPEKRGYKAYVYFALCIGKWGVQVRVVMKDESLTRPDFGQNLIRNLAYFENEKKSFKNLFNYTKKNKEGKSLLIEDPYKSFQEIGERLCHFKTALFDVGFELNPFSSDLEEQFLLGAQKLFPFYLCGLEKAVKL